MNKKMKKLAKQADWRKPGGLPSEWNDGDYVVNQEQMKKFAELIIAECIEAAGDPADGLILDDTWHDGVRASVWSIKQHFEID